MGDKIGLGFVSICGSFIIVLFSALLLMKPIHVKRSTVYQKNKCWHYMELSKVVVTKTRICRVYSEGKMIFWLLVDVNDFYCFLAWAERCGVPIKKSVL